jgi:hypothetical protein
VPYCYASHQDHSKIQHCRILKGSVEVTISLKRIGKERTATQKTRRLDVATSLNPGVSKLMLAGVTAERSGAAGVSGLLHRDCSGLVCLLVLSFWCADQWSQKAIRRKTTGTGRIRYLKTIGRKFKNGFREGECLLRVRMPMLSICCKFSVWKLKSTCFKSLLIQPSQSSPGLCAGLLLLPESWANLALKSVVL